MLSDIFIEIIGCIIGFVVVMFSISLIYDKGIIKDNGDEIIFKFSKELIYLCLAVSIIMIAVIGCGLLFGEDEKILVLCACGPLAVLFISLYAYLKLKVIRYKNGTFYVKGLFKKEKTFEMSDIFSATLKVGDKMVLKTRNNKKFSVDVQMENYLKLIELLEKNNIKYDEKKNYLR